MSADVITGPRGQLAAERRALCVEVLTELGLDTRLASRLRATTRSDLRAEALALAAAGARPLHNPT